MLCMLTWALMGCDEVVAPRKVFLLVLNDQYDSPSQSDKSRKQSYEGLFVEKLTSLAQAGRPALEVAETEFFDLKKECPTQGAGKKIALRCAKCWTNISGI